MCRGCRKVVKTGWQVVRPWMASCQLLMMGTWLPETCWATSRREIKNTKVTSSWFFISTQGKCKYRHSIDISLKYNIWPCVRHLLIYEHQHNNFHTHALKILTSFSCSQSEFIWVRICSYGWLFNTPWGRKLNLFPKFVDDCMVVSYVLNDA